MRSARFRAWRPFSRASCSCCRGCCSAPWPTRFRYSATWGGMHGNLPLSAGTLYAFLLVLARVGGVLIFVPIPGFRAAPEMVRAVLALGFTVALFGRWPAVDATQVGPATLVGWVLSEST